jgi:hypothetical protein
LSQQQLENTKDTLESAKEKLEQFEQTENQAALDGLTKHDLTGAILQAGVQSYYAVNDTQDIIAQKQAGVVQYPFLTYGTFSTNLTPEYRYGLPLAVKMGGVVMDIDKILHTKVEINNDREKLTAYNLSRGPSYSLNENLVPEQLFDNPDTPEKEADGISATKALSLAAQQGQTIYTVTKANYAEVLLKLNHSDVVMTDIRNGINAGKTVTVHDTQITLNGWKGTGYTILDPQSGAGAYMIGGGLDGGFTNFFGENQNIITFFLGLGALATLALPILFIPILLITIFSAFMITMYNNLALMEAGCEELTGLNWVVNILAVSAGVLFGSSIVSTIWSAIFGWVYIVSLK